MNCFFHSEEQGVALCVDCGKSLCKACAEKYEISLCDNCNLKRNEVSKKLAIKDFIPSLILFIVSFIAILFLTNTSKEQFPLVLSRILLSIFAGWFLAGAVWGLIYTRSWFKPKKVYIKKTSGLDANDFFKSFGSIARIFASVIVGPFLMTIKFVKLIITLINAKKVTNSVNANKTESS